jgi:type II secretory pathway predicted ATPase ExeA
VEHLQHFGLNDDPFRHDPIERYQLDVPSQHDALLRVDRGVRQARCLVVVSGGVGAGKSTILRKLYEELEEEVFEASMMLVLRGRVDADWLLRRFAVQLGVEEPPTEREALVGQIYERLAIIREDGRHAVLIIDGADALAVPETLAELFALVKLEYEDRRLLTVVLAGSHKLTEVIDADAALVQQIEVRVELEKFSREESARYLGGRVDVAGGAARILLPGAVAALHELSDGCPGRLNTLADNAFFESYLAGRSEVAKSDVERACADLRWTPKARVVEAPPVPHPVTSEVAPARQPHARGVQGGSPQAEITAPQDGLVDLDSELEAVFEPELPGPECQATLMDLEVPAAIPPQQPRLVTEPTEIQLDVLDAPPKDEVDDLFMELLDD